MATGELQFEVPADRIDLGVGHPDPALLPLDMVRRAADACLGDGDTSVLGYGAQPGSRSFREALAGFLGTAGYGAPVAPETLFVTAGVSHGLDLVCAQLTRPGDVVLVERPTYFAALRILADRGLTVASVPTDEAGLIASALPELFARHRPRFLYTIPVYHNPAGTTLSPARRRQLLTLAAEHGVYVVADEVYQLLSHAPRDPPPAMCANEPELRWLISLGAFTKILAPGVRLGWIQAAAELCRRLADSGVRFSAGGVNPMTAAIVRRVLERGQRDHLSGLRRALRARAAALVAALAEHLPAAVRHTPPEGGYFVWLQLPPGHDTRDLVERAHQLGVGFRPGALFAADPGIEHCLRIGFSYYGEERLAKGAERLGRLLADAIGRR